MCERINNVGFLEYILNFFDTDTFCVKKSFEFRKQWDFTVGQCVFHNDRTIFRISLVRPVSRKSLKLHHVAMNMGKDGSI